TTFHRVIPRFVIQGGDIMSRDSSRHNDGTGGPGWFMDAEFNDIPHEAGIISMARAQDLNSAGSQFFICLSKLPMLDNAYSVFGKVVTGMDVVNNISQVDRDPADNPYERVVVERAYVVSRDQLTE
ncbi:peptidylprolyl isomerase, partial [bacterium]|nr:peptidylprolyl isomerase [bacterium]